MSDSYELFELEVIPASEMGGSLRGERGPQGPGGESAYQVAVRNGFVGSEADWLKSLKGDKGNPGEKGEKGDAGRGINGERGRSAYEVAQRNGFTGTEQEWLISLKGPKGDQGDPYVFSESDVAMVKNSVMQDVSEITDAAEQAAHDASIAADDARAATVLANEAADLAREAAESTDNIIAVTRDYIDDQGFLTQEDLTDTQLLGSPTAPTADEDDQSYRIANTAFVKRVEGNLKGEILSNKTAIEQTVADTKTELQQAIENADPNLEILTDQEIQDIWDELEPGTGMGVNPIPVARGGTGANNAADACKNLQAYSLGLGEEITAGADLNDYITPGIYWCKDENARHSNVANLPFIFDDISPGYGFRLVVELAAMSNDYNTQIITQTLYIRGGGPDGVVWSTSVFKRNYIPIRSGNKFSGWGAIGGIDSIVADGKAGNWTWQKYANGCAHLLYLANVQVSQYGTAANGYFSYFWVPNYPFSLVDSVNNAKCEMPETGIVSMFAGFRNPSNTNVGAPYFYHASNPGNFSAYLAIDVWGRWK